VKTALINLFIAVVLCVISVIIMYYNCNEAHGIWDEIISLIASWETFAIIVMWKLKKHERTAKNG
jgi:hypothetical protein